MKTFIMRGVTTTYFCQHRVLEWEAREYISTKRYVQEKFSLKQYHKVIWVFKDKKVLDFRLVITVLENIDHNDLVS